MSFVKDEATARLDDLHREGMEAVGLFEDLEERIEDVDLEGIVAGHTARQRALLERVANLRRERGELPHAADPERSHLEAAGAFVRAVLLPGQTRSHYVQSLLEAASKVQKRLDEALALNIDREMRRLLESFREDNAAFQDELQRRL